MQQIIRRRVFSRSRGLCFDMAAVFETYVSYVSITHFSPPATARFADVTGEYNMF